MAGQMVKTLGSLKGVALKLGQSIALSQDTQPEAVRRLLYQMFAQVPALDFEKIRTVLTAELGQEFEKVFAQLDHAPFAAASLGQVHRGVLLDGTEVAVKIQYPRAKQTLRQDLQNLGAVMKTAGLGMNLFDEKSYLHEIQTQFSQELDYDLEQRHLEQYRQSVSPWPELRVPKSYPELSSASVLVTELLEGEVLTDVCAEPAKWSAEQRFVLGKQLIRAVYGPFLRDGLVHGDCHPGNFLFLKNGGLGILDFGCVRHFSKPFWHAYRHTIQAALHQDFSQVFEITQSAGFRIQISENKARALLNDLSVIVSRPFLVAYDFGACHIRKDILALVRERPQDFLRIRPPAEGIFFFRSIVGLMDMLRALQCEGDFRSVFIELLGDSHCP